MKIHIILNGAGGELDRRTVDKAEEISAALIDLAEVTTFALGDTIVITDDEARA